MGVLDWGKGQGRVCWTEAEAAGDGEAGCSGQCQAGTKVASNTGAGSGALSLMLMQNSETLKLAKTLYCGLRLSFVHFGELGRGW